MKLRISAGPVTPLCLSSPRGENGYQPLIALRGGAGGLPQDRQASHSGRTDNTLNTLRGFIQCYGDWVIPTPSPKWTELC